ncbi:hypothetical protein PS1_016074 [Malus domestica]
MHYWNLHQVLFLVKIGSCVWVQFFSLFQLVLAGPYPPLRGSDSSPNLYKYYRNTMVIKSRVINLFQKLTFTKACKSLIGDIGSIKRVFDFLEAWGLINYIPSALNKPLKWEDNSKVTDASSNGGGESPAGCAKESPKKRTCNGCKYVSSIASTKEI